ncbi:MAG: hypothetical protein KAI66_15390 [Lentisphaeria bacterium]|nr:hypothetical protein [Lentisphaeria bacterium]
MRTTIVFDVEDYVTPPSGELDDLLKMLADVMTEEQISGTFFLIGEKLRSLRDRGRSDVIEALARHDLGSHVNLGSIHPTLTERMEHTDWANGAARMAAEEIAGIDELSAIAGRPLRSFARHGGSYSPQLLTMLGRRGYPYIYSPVQLPKHNINWFCNTLNFYEDGSVFQEAYHTEEALRAAEAKFESYLRERRGFDWAMIFQSHPCHIKTQSFWDKNYYAGQNPQPEDWKTPEFYPEFSMQAVQRNWGAHCARLRDNPDLTIATISELATEFGRQAVSAGTKEIKVLASRAAECREPFHSDRFTAAEILDILARAYVCRAESGTLPTILQRRNVDGPTEMPPAVPTARRLGPEALLRAARGVSVAVDMTGRLPSGICCGEGTIGSAGEVGIASILRALGESLASGRQDQDIVPIPVAPYPSTAETVVDAVRKYRKWSCHRPDLDMDTICRLSALQCWTLKPAWPGRPPEFGAS